MTDYVKPNEMFKDDKIVFQPLTKESVERFSVWDVVEKKFINEGETIIINGVSKNVDKYIKLSDEDKKRWNRNLKFRREVIIEGKEYVYDVPLSIENELKKQMAVLEKLRKDPLTYTYVITRHKVGVNRWDVRYEVIVGDEISMTPVIPEPQINLEEDEIDYELSDVERKYVEAIKKKYPDYATKDNSVWEKILIERIGLSPDRATYVVGEYLNV